jgi:hypothetical protein
MNIFAIDDSPIESARYLCDQHVIKMPTESLEMLCLAIQAHGAKISDLPLTKVGRPFYGSHKNHPCTKWAKNSRGNFLWLYEHGLELCKEYTARYNKIHYCEKGILGMKKWANNMSGEREDFAIAIAEDKECRKMANFNIISTVNKYRLYYKYDKKFATWRRNRPKWME